MKKIISVLFAASLMFVVFACAPKTEAPANDEQNQEEQKQDEQNQDQGQTLDESEEGEAQSAE